MRRKTVYGRHIIEEYLSKPESIQKIYILKTGKIDSIVEKVNALKINIEFTDRHTLQNITGTDKNQGIAAFILEENSKKASLLSSITNKKRALFVILDHIQDPHNLGAVIRSAAAMNVDGIIIPNKKCTKVNSTVEKVSAGTINKINIFTVSNLSQSIDILKTHNYWIIGTCPSRGEQLNNFNFPEKSAIVVGNEGKGISHLLLKKCDFLVNIKLHNNVESLNTSVAAGIMIYSYMKQYL